MKLVQKDFRAVDVEPPATKLWEVLRPFGLLRACGWAMVYFMSGKRVRPWADFTRIRLSGNPYDPFRRAYFYEPGTIIALGDSRCPEYIKLGRFGEDATTFEDCIRCHPPRFDASRLQGWLLRAQDYLKDKGIHHKPIETLEKLQELLEKRRNKC